MGIWPKDWLELISTKVARKKDRKVAKAACKRIPQFCAEIGQRLWADWQAECACTRVDGLTNAQRLKQHYSTQQELRRETRERAFASLTGVETDIACNYDPTVDWEELLENCSPEGSQHSGQYINDTGIAGTRTASENPKQDGQAKGRSTSIHSILDPDDLIADEESDGEIVLQDVWMNGYCSRRGLYI